MKSKVKNVLCLKIFLTWQALYLGVTNESSCSQARLGLEVTRSCKITRSWANGGVVRFNYFLKKTSSCTAGLFLWCLWAKGLSLVCGHELSSLIATLGMLENLHDKEEILKCELNRYVFATYIEKWSNIGNQLLSMTTLRASNHMLLVVSGHWTNDMLIGNDSYCLVVSY